MALTDALTVLYLGCFAGCAWPGIWRIVSRGTSDDLSVWREYLLLVGVTAQFLVMVLTGADWRVRISPICSGVAVVAMLWCIRRYRAIR